jgi:hypothetical protein
VGIAAAIIVAACTAAWLREALIYPHDPYRADMLVVIQLAVKRLLQGGDPYSIYHVPWDVPLPYGERLVDDVLHRTHTADDQARTFLVMEIALRAEREAQRLKSQSA